MKVPIIAACANASGAPVFARVTVEATPTQVEDGQHYDRAKEALAEQGYEEPFVMFDAQDVRALHEGRIKDGLRERLLK